MLLKNGKASMQFTFTKFVSCPLPLHLLKISNGQSVIVTFNASFLNLHGCYRYISKFNFMNYQFTNLAVPLLYIKAFTQHRIKSKRQGREDVTWYDNTVLFIAL